jgi:hypothetical protein
MKDYSLKERDLPNRGGVNRLLKSNMGVTDYAKRAPATLARLDSHILTRNDYAKGKKNGGPR